MQYIKKKCTITIIIKACEQKLNYLQTILLKTKIVLNTINK